MLRLDDYKFENKEEREAARGMMEAFTKMDNERMIMQRQKYLFVNFIMENDLEDDLVKFMKAKTNEGVNYWYEKAASEFLETDLEIEDENVLHDDYEFMKILKNKCDENVYFD
ncbi:hypothetical protein [Lentibacillus salicampi]|uniref:Uncharacterized protein n=1 Tax=Lentibacillus salicampi TaxID=175306 RepID=A0A4Y9AGX8_9BACI|nr:hypothetical protein [Lentibacillus salicampi]TFJ93641.1 hypothetical protein E4U82_06705 [Lentibacillus salicampi]